MRQKCDRKCRRMWPMRLPQEMPPCWSLSQAGLAVSGDPVDEHGMMVSDTRSDGDPRISSLESVFEVMIFEKRH